MNLKGKSVSHKVFGEGTIKKQIGDHIILTFKEGDRQILYNETFKNYITVKDQNVADFIENDIKNKSEK